MAMQVPDYIRTLVPYVPGKPIEETQREYGIKRIVKLASNENPLGPSPKAIAAAKRALSETHRYPDGSAYRLKAALSEKLSVAANRILVGNGSNELIDMIIRTYCVPGDAMVTSQAAFIAYKLCAQIHGVHTIETPLTRDLRFDLPAMSEQVKKNPRVKVVFIANPNNPTGTYVTTTELRAFLREVSGMRGESVLVVLDYAYWEYVTAKDLPDAAHLMAEFPNVLVLRTFSKIHGLAGFRLGYAAARPELIADIDKTRQPFNVNSVAMSAAEAALSDAAFVRKARAVNSAGMKFWEKTLRKMGIPFWPSQGNFLLADFRQFGESGAQIYQALLKEGVILRPVANYDLPTALRISIGTDEENSFAADALERVLFEKGGGKKGSKKHGDTKARPRRRD